jgi:hypothetical protein
MPPTSLHTELIEGQDPPQAGALAFSHGISVVVVNDGFVVVVSPFNVVVVCGTVVVVSPFSVVVVMPFNVVVVCGTVVVVCGTVVVVCGMVVVVGPLNVVVGSFSEVVVVVEPDGSPQSARQSLPPDLQTLEVSFAVEVH